jgi:hypothetical protein
MPFVVHVARTAVWWQHERLHFVRSHWATYLTKG